MDQQSIVLYLPRKGLPAVAIHDDLVATLGAEAVSYPSMTHYLGEGVFTSSNRSIHSRKTVFKVSRGISSRITRIRTRSSDGVSA
jgi:hypothetical protein